VKAKPRSRRLSTPLDQHRRVGSLLRPPMRTLPLKPVDGLRELAPEFLWLDALVSVYAIPYKVYATESGVAGTPLAELIAWTPAARAWRFLLTAVGAALIGRVFTASVRRNEGRWFVATLGFWLVVYVRYFARLRRRYG
jgi:hypothetical protein